MLDDQSTCPGCGLELPKLENGVSHKYINSSAECWDLYCQLLEYEYSNPMAFDAMHQLSVDAYTAQHPGGTHPDKSVAIHLVGLYAALVANIPVTEIPQIRKHLADAVKEWPRFPPPEKTSRLTIKDVVELDSLEEKIAMVTKWSQSVWNSWSNCHAEIEQLYLTIFK